MTVFVVSLAGAVGAVCRYLISGWIQYVVRYDFPAGTLVINLSGSLGLGLMVGTGPLDSTLILCVVGFMGGFTTFSTWMIETIRLGLRSPLALLNLMVSLVGGLAAAAVGFTLTN